MKHSVTLGELSDKVVALSWKRIAKNAAVLYVVQAIAGASFGLYIGVMYPEKVLETVTLWRN